jgi:hypothetical protein
LKINPEVGGFNTIANKPEEAPMDEITFSQFQDAALVFAKDYTIVHHDNDPIVQYGKEPRVHGEYTLMGLEGMDEQELLNLLSEVNVVVYGCMDKRGAKATYEKVIALARERGIENPRVLAFFQGGGIIGRDELVRDGQTVQANRGQALKTMGKYVALHAPKVQLVIATDHNRGCGAETYAANDESWPDRLECKPGDVEENNKMKQLIHEYAVVLIPEEWKVKLEEYLVVFPEDESPNIMLESI